MRELHVVGDRVFFDKYLLGERPKNTPESVWSHIRDVIEKPTFDIDELMHDMHRAGLVLKSFTKNNNGGDYAVLWSSKDQKFSCLSQGFLFASKAFMESAEKAKTEYALHMTDNCF